MRKLTACACCVGVPWVNAPGEAGLGGCAYGKPDCPKNKQEIINSKWLPTSIRESTIKPKIIKSIRIMF